MYNTYALQQHKTSGETFVLDYDNDSTIVGVCGPLDLLEVEDARRNADSMGSYWFDEANSDGLGDDGFVEWHPPIATYDPNTGETFIA